MVYFVAFFCFAITLHNIEEAIWLPEWSQQSSKFQKPVTSNEFHFAVIVITMLAYLSAFIYARIRYCKMDFHWLSRFYGYQRYFSTSYRNCCNEKVCTWTSYGLIA